MGVLLGEVGCGVVLIVVFWEVGGGYGGVTAENGRKRDGMEGNPFSFLLGPARPWQPGKGARSCDERGKWLFS